MSISEKPQTEPNRYKTERNTEALVKTVISARPINRLSGKDIWWLIKLTWITKNRGRVVEDHWKSLKVPALSHLFNRHASATGKLHSTLESMNLPAQVMESAVQRTGFVNLYTAYRNSSKEWCIKNEEDIKWILNTARSLGPNDQERFDLASKIMEMNPIPTPYQKRHKGASSLLTPIVACLDPKMRFPIINGEEGVNQRLAKLGLANNNLVEQVRGFINLIGQFGLVDAFAIDTMTDSEIDKISRRRNTVQLLPFTTARTSLRTFDENEREAIQQAATIKYRKRHNKITNRIRKLLAKLKLYEGTDPDCRYDTLVENYDGMGRDLLIEAKPDADKGSIRVAIGQLFDYRRFLKNQAATDLAILTILPPSKNYIELLQDLQITPLWFTDEECQILSGQGKIWKSLEAQLSNR